MKRHVRIAGLLAVTLAAHTAAAQPCPGDLNCDQSVTIDEIITAVNAALNGCPAGASCGGRLPASAQTTAYGTGSDGAVQAGAALSYTDNGDGTITDNNTGLVWEKKDNSGGIHDVGDTYTWGMTSEPYTMNGTMITVFLASLNRPPCFAGRCDWRIPNVRELQSIVDYEIPYPGPVVNAAFHNAAGCTGCTDVRLASCSCTASNFYWSSTTDRGFPDGAWGVGFGGAHVCVGGGLKSIYTAVRAVRGGL